MERCVVLANPEQSLVVGSKTRHLLNAAPVDLVDRVGGLVGVVVALLCASELGARRHERNALRGEQECIDLLHLSLIVCIGAGVVGTAVTLYDLIPHDEVIVRVGV